MNSQNFLAFALVLTFFLLGLAGVVICHVLKRRGYRCTTAQEEDDDEVFEEADRDAELGGKREVYISHTACVSA